MDSRRKSQTDLVQSDVAQVTDLLELAAGQTQRSEIPEDKVVVRTVGLELVVVLSEGVGDGARVFNHLGGVGLEGWVCSLLECDGDTGNGLCG